MNTYMNHYKFYILMWNLINSIQLCIVRKEMVGKCYILYNYKLDIFNIVLFIGLNNMNLHMMYIIELIIKKYIFNNFMGMVNNQQLSLLKLNNFYYYMKYKLNYCLYILNMIMGIEHI